MRVRRVAPVVLLVCLACAAAAAAQPPGTAGFPATPSDPGFPDAPAPISLAYADGRVDLVRPDGVEAAQAPDLLDEDDRLVTAEGRAELVIDDGSVAHVDRESDVRVDRGVRLRLVRGRLRVHTPADIEALYLASPAGPVRLAAAGVYDLSAADLDGDTVITVVAGHAALITGDTETPIGADDVLRVDPRDPRPRWERGTPRDSFADWSDQRMYRSATAPHAALPPPVQPWAADLAANGQWSAVAPYGPVWFPAAGPGWRPYQYGAWRFTRYGWTWIDAQRWAWPVHHYGRWGHHAARGWYWIPHRAWGPAWVGWAVAADHVAWSPLGWDRRPLVDFSVGARLGPGGLFASTWSILPRHAFGRRGWIDRDLTDPRYLPGPVLGGFVSQMIGPRGPAGPGDRFAARPGRRAVPPGPQTSPRGGITPPIAYQPPGARPREERAPYSPPRRRPMDAPPVDPAAGAPGVGAPESAPAPPEGAYGAPAVPRRGPREQAPVGAPIRTPRVESPPAPTPSAPVEPAASPGRARPRAGSGGEGAGTGGARGGAPSAAPRERRPAGGDGAAGGAGSTGQGRARRRG